MRSRVLRAGDGRRARLILMLSEGRSWSAIQQALVAHKASLILEAWKLGRCVRYVEAVPFGPAMPRLRGLEWIGIPRRKGA